MIAKKAVLENSAEPLVAIDEVNRVLELGRLLLSVLTPEELEHLQQILNNQTAVPGGSHRWLK